MHCAEDALNVLRTELGGMHGWQHRCQHSLNLGRNSLYVLIDIYYLARVFVSLLS
jgi:hypothetical protein